MRTFALYLVFTLLVFSACILILHSVYLHPKASGTQSIMRLIHSLNIECNAQSAGSIHPSYSWHRIS